VDFAAFEKTTPNMGCKYMVNKFVFLIYSYFFKEKNCQAFMLLPVLKLFSVFEIPAFAGMTGGGLPID